MTKAEKVFLDKDDAGRERRVVATEERDGFWRFKLTHPDGLTKTDTMTGSHGAAERRAADMLANYRLEFNQARQRGDQAPTTLPDRSRPVPPDGPIGYGSKPTARRY